MDVINDLVRYVVKTKYEDIPGKVVNHDKNILLDSLGCILAGSSAPAIKEIVEVVREMGGKEESSVMVFGGKVPSMMAALANASIAQARDFDDTHDAAILHPHASVLSTALAVSEATGTSGKEFLTAVILGVEVECRIGVAIKTALSFTRTGTLGYFGATAAAGKLLGLSQDELVNAFGIVYAQVSTTLQSVIDGALVKRMHPGFAGKAAILSCKLARKGITGCKEVLEGEYGYLNLYEKGDYDREQIIDGLGKRYEVNNLSVKPYPCARDMHGALDIAVELFQEGKVDVDRIKEVVITMPKAAFDVSGKPYEAISGHEVVEAILNGAYCTATALVYGRVEIGNFTPDGVKDPKVIDLAKKTKTILDPKLPVKGLVPMSVKITYEDGAVIERTTEVLKGDPANPLSADELEEKFRLCAKYAVVPFEEERLLGIMEEVKQIEERPNTDRLVSLMIPN
ncbi:MAG: MmgE/PrpD family protein [Pseudomonadota bacterium]